VAHVGQVLGDLHDMPPGQSLVVEDQLDAVHRTPGLRFDVDRMAMLVGDVRMPVVERRRGRARDENNVGRSGDTNGRRVRHVSLLIRSRVHRLDALRDAGAVIARHLPPPRQAGKRGRRIGVARSSYFAYSSHFGHVRFSAGTSNGPVVVLSITMPLMTMVSGTGSLRRLRSAAIVARHPIL